jgi:septum formation protein
MLGDFRKAGIVMTQVILASGSPYRRELLQRLGIPFRVVVAGVDESDCGDESGASLASRLGVAKARAVADDFPEALVIGSDQVAECAGRLLGKPGSIERAREQLAFCSGREIIFHSSVAVIRGQRQAQGLVPTRVRLRRLSDDQIADYVERDQPLDCAGAMRSEALGIALAESIRSDDPTALIGLPLIATVTLLTGFGVKIP